MSIGLPALVAVSGALVILAVAGGVLAHRFGLARGRREALTDPSSGLASRERARTFLDGAVALAAGPGAEASRRSPGDHHHDPQVIEDRADGNGSSAHHDPEPVSVAFFQVRHTRDREPGDPGARTGEAAAALARVLRDRTPLSGLSGRWSDVKFLTVLPGYGRSGVVEFSEEVRDELRRQDLPWGPVALSAGLAVFDATMGSSEVLLASADQALAMARDNGVDEYVVAEDGTGGRTWSQTPDDESGPRSAALPEGSLPSLSSQEVHVLLIDDDDAVRSSLDRMLERLGYHVTAAADAEEALRAVKEQAHRLDLVVTDVILPDRNGFALAEELLRYRPDLPILYVSGHLYGEISWSGVPGETTDFLEKPVEMDQLAVKVEGILRHLRSTAAALG